MSWINNVVNRYRLRNLSYNSSVCMSRKNIEEMMRGFDTFFDDFTNFTDEIASLQLYPFKIKSYVTGEINVLETAKGWMIGVNAYDISWQAYYQTLGEFYVRHKYNNFIDYKGYTQIKVFLPFLGFVDVDINECIGKYLQFRLLTDFTTGKGLYIIGVSNSSIQHPNNPYVYDGEDDNVRVISVFECDIGIEIPLGKSNVGDIKRNLLLGTIKTATSLAVTSYTNSLPPPSTTTVTDNVSIGSARGDYKGARMIPRTMTKSHTEETTTHEKVINKSKPYQEVIDGSIDVLNRNSHIGNTDRVSDSMLMFQVSKNIQVVIYRPKILPITSDYNHLYGQPLGEVRQISTLSGYTEISKVHFEGSGFDTCTSREYMMIEQAFSDGVLL